MWVTLGTYALRFAIWCLRNPNDLDHELQHLHNLVITIFLKGQQR